jgi:hypothetical protein
MRPSTVVAVACVALCAGDACADSRSFAGSFARSVDRRSPQSQPTLVGPGVTVAIDDAGDPEAARKLGVLALTLTLANRSGVALNVSYRSFALSGDGDERYPALLPSELVPGERPASPLREGILVNGETLTAVLLFRAPPPQPLPIELRVDLSDVNDSPIARIFLPIDAHGAPRG